MTLYRRKWASYIKSEKKGVSYLHLFWEKFEVEKTEIHYVHSRSIQN